MSDRHLRTHGLLAPSLLLTLTLAACGSGGEAPAVETPAEPIEASAVHASTYPLAYFAERIGGEYVDVTLPVPTGVDPAAWAPSPETVLAFQEADLILLNGATYEGWVETVSLPASRVVNTSAGFSDEYIEIENAVTHSHGPEGEHSHGETASATWLDPNLAIRQAAAVRDALAAARPDGADRFNEGYEALAADLRALDESLAAATAALDDKRFLAPSSDFAYLAGRHGLDVRIVRYDPEATVSGYWHDVEHELSHSRTMLWSAPPPPEIASRLADGNVSVIHFDAAAAQPAQGDYLDVMRANIARLGDASE